tara:strand:+ start:1892 stop:2275 length:384 start_codon:yes stop_codon:yes gene_type:complete
MLNLLFLVGISQAADVYKISRKATFQWYESNEQWVQRKTQAFPNTLMPTIIVYDDYITTDELTLKYSSITDDGDVKCYVIREDYNLCLERSTERLVMQKTHKNGQIWLTEFRIALYNGYPATSGSFE